MKSPLGRGLASLLGEAGPSAASRTTLLVTQLEPGPFQPRVAMDPAALTELTDSIRQQGVLQPILARPHPDEAGRFQIIAGERRWRAATAAGLHEVPVLIKALNDSAAMAAALVENLQRQDLDAIEEADGYNRLIDDFGLTQDQIGDLVGKSRSHIANMLRLRHLPATVRAQVQAGALSAGHARALLQHSEPEAAAKLVIARGLNVRQTEALASRPVAKVATPKDQEHVALERELGVLLGLRVTITQSGAGGVVQIGYRNLDQLDGLLARLHARG